MNFDDFMNELEQDVASFEEYWRKLHLTSSESFPMELDALEDWYEQFDAYIARVD